VADSGGTHSPEAWIATQSTCGRPPRMGNQWEAAPRGRAQRNVQVGPGLGVTHRRPGRYTAAMAPGLGMQGWPLEPSGVGEKRKASREGGSAAKRFNAEAGREALKDRGRQRRGGTKLVFSARGQPIPRPQAPGPGSALLSSPYPSSYL
jgi:hypothetical protein